MHSFSRNTNLTIFFKSVRSQGYSHIRCFLTHSRNPLDRKMIFRKNMEIFLGNNGGFFSTRFRLSVLFIQPKQR